MSVSGNKLILQLQKDLPDVCRSTISDVVRVVKRKTPRQSMDAIAMSLLDSKIDVGHILSALLRCEWFAVHELMQGISSDNLNEQIHTFSESIEHFNALQAAVIDSAQQQWEKQLRLEHRQRVLAESRMHWLSHKQAEIYNYFREVPISAHARVLDVDEDFIWLHLTPEVLRVFSVADRGNTAILKSADEAFSVHALFHRVEEDRLCLSIHDISGIKRERRDDLRLQPDETIPVKLKWNHEEILGDLDDISRSGMRVKLPHHFAMRHNEEISCEWMLNDVHYTASGIIRWAKEKKRRPCIGIELDLDRLRKQSIHRYMILQQKLISQRLNLLAPPDWLRHKRA